MFDEFLKYWEMDRQRSSTKQTIAQHGEAYTLSWSFYFYLGGVIELPNKEYQDLILHTISPRMFDGIDRKDYDSVMLSIKREFELIGK